MKIEFLTRWSKFKAPENTGMSKEEKDLKRIIDGEGEDEMVLFMPEVEYEYTKLFLDLEDIKAVNEYDKEHCVIRTFSGDVYTVKANYRTVKYMYESLTATMIKNIDNFQFEEQLLNKVDKINKILTEPEQIESKPDEVVIKKVEDLPAPKNKKNNTDLDNLLDIL